MAKPKKQPPTPETIVPKQYEMVSVGSLEPHPDNVNQGDVGAIVESIKANRFYGAVTAQKSSRRILAGKHRWLAAKECGLAEVPVLWLDVSDAEARRIMLVDNRTTRLGLDDPAALTELLQRIRSEQGSLIGTGFDDDALQDLLNDLGMGGAKPEGPKFQSDKIKAGSVADLAPADEERAILAGRKLLIEYSGGKDSSATAIWARHYFPENETELLFVDMGADFVGFHLYLHRAGEYLGAPLVLLRSQRTVIDTILAKGEWPGFLHPFCHKCLHDPLDAYLRKHQPADIVVLRGGRLAERSAAGKRNESRFLVVDRMKEYKYFQPLYFSDKETSHRLLKEAGAPIWEGYSRGLCRTACRMCPGQRPYAYSAIRANFPEVWAELGEMEARLGPGAWQGRGEDGSIPTFGELADRGQAKFEAGEEPDGEDERPPV